MKKLNNAVFETRKFQTSSVIRQVTSVRSDVSVCCYFSISFPAFCMKEGELLLRGELLLKWAAAAEAIIENNF